MAARGKCSRRPRRDRGNRWSRMTDSSIASAAWPRAIMRMQNRIYFPCRSCSDSILEPNAGKMSRPCPHRVPAMTPSLSETNYTLLAAGKSVVARTKQSGSRTRLCLILLIRKRAGRNFRSPSNAGHSRWPRLARGSFVSAAWTAITNQLWPWTFMTRPPVNGQKARICLPANMKVSVALR